MGDLPPTSPQDRIKLVPSKDSGFEDVFTIVKAPKNETKDDKKSILGSLQEKS